MANKPKNKMDISHRAKQFLPFSALKGLSEALAQKEQLAEAVHESEFKIPKQLSEPVQCNRQSNCISIPKEG